VKVPPITFAFSGGVLRDAIGIALIAAFIGALIALMWKDIPKPNEQLIVYMLGQLSGFVATVVGFHYVTKSGEKELDAQRAANTENAFEAIKQVARTTPPRPEEEAAHAADQVVGAAADEADQIKRGE
jgi:hypothetical protein